VTSPILRLQHDNHGCDCHDGNDDQRTDVPANVSYFDSFLDHEQWVTDHNALDQIAVSAAQFAELPLALLGARSVPVCVLITCRTG
jgi:hypothetical protein